MTIVLAVLAGIALGAVLRRGDFCFHSTWRGVFDQPARTSLLRAYVALLLVSTPIVQFLSSAGTIDPFVPGFAPVAAIGGGLVFGVGMVIAQTCVSGMFYKLGAGMLGMVVAIAAWAVGDIATWQGPLEGLRNRMNERVVTVDSGGVEEVATVTSLLGAWGVLLALATGVGLGLWALRDKRLRAAAEALATDALPWRGVRLGAITAAVIVVTWLLAAVHGSDYPFGTSSTPTQVWNATARGQDVAWWIPLALVSIIGGALAMSVKDATLWVRGESAIRYGQLALGGFVMGVGAAIAGGCNLGHSMVGVPLLSLGSIVTTLAIAAGVFLATRLARLG